MVIQGVSYPSDFEAKKALTAAAAALSRKGSMPAGDGSLSVRVGPNALWITVDGADKAELSQDMMVRVDLSGRQSATNRPKPLGCDLETHLRLYRENDNIRCVIHAYPVRTVMFSAENRGLEPASFSPSVRKLGRLKLVNAPDPEKAAENIALCAKSDHGALIKNEGCMMWGGSVREVLSFFESLDYYCKAMKYFEHSALSAAGSEAQSICKGECTACSREAVCGQCHGECGSCPLSGSCSKAVHSFQSIPAGIYPSYASMPAEGAKNTETAASSLNESIALASLPKGMTGIIRPGSPLPAIPKEPEITPVSDVAAVKDPVETAKYAVVQKATASGAGCSSPESIRHPSADSAAVINAPKAAVISEVVRRTVS